MREIISLWKLPDQIRCALNNYVRANIKCLHKEGVMRRRIFLVLGLAVCLMVCLIVPVTTEADSLYVGDYCWATAYGPIIFSAFFLGLDSNGHEIINYIGRWNDFPVNGNCIEKFIGKDRIYDCNILETYKITITGATGNKVLSLILDYFSLNGQATGVATDVNGLSIFSSYVSLIFTPIDCPSW